MADFASFNFAFFSACISASKSSASPSSGSCSVSNGVPAGASLNEGASNGILTPFS